MKYLEFTLFSFFITLFISCSNNSPNDLIETKIENTNKIISYQTDVKQIMTSNCISCHGTIPTNGPMSLNDYTSVKDAILNRGLINRINLPQSNSAAMPTGGPRLQEQQIDVIVAWQNQGFTN